MKKTPKKTLLKIAGVLIFLAVIVSVGVFVFFRVSASPYVVDGETVLVKISVPPGTTMRSVSENLKSSGIIKNADVFYLAARFAPIRFLITGTTGGTKSAALKSGMYEVHKGMSYADLFEIFSDGRDEYVRVTVPEGYTLSMIARLLDDNGVCGFAQFMDAAKDGALISEYKIASVSFEGYLFPDTYFFAPGMSAKSVIRTMADNFFERIKDIDGLGIGLGSSIGQSDVSSGISMERLNEIVILASIVEREYRAVDEAPLIASVFKNRHDREIGLYSCATIVYIITEIQGKPHPDRITYADLEIDSPYNTYKWAALPPTPISNPGIVALRAAANPPETNYYYFRVVDAEAGRHVFTTNFNEHVSEGNLYTKKR